MRTQTAKRKVERVLVGQPLEGRIGNAPAVVRDVSVLGCRVETDGSLKVGQLVQLRFRWDQEPVAIECSVARCTLTPGDQRAAGALAYTSGLKFLEATSESVQSLRRMIATQVEQAFAEQIANAHAEVPGYLRDIAILKGSDLGDPYAVRQRFESSTLIPWLRSARTRGYLRWELEGNRWKKTRTQSPQQPPAGFTLWAWESEDQVHLLQKAWEEADPAFQSIIRLCAELSLIVDDTIPPQKFQPRV